MRLRMPQFATSGTTGVPKTYSITEEQIARRIAHMNDASRGVGFEALKSIFIDWAPDTYIGVVYARYAEQHGMRAYHVAQDSIEATVEFFRSENIEGITSTPQGLHNYAQAAKGSHKFKWLLASTARLTPTMSRAIRAGLGDNLWSSYAANEIGIISIASANMIETIPNCVGKIVPDIEVRFENREIVLKSDLLISGYKEDPKLAAARFKDGWYYTHDLGHIDAEEDVLILDGRRA